MTVWTALTVAYYQSDTFSLLDTVLSDFRGTFHKLSNNVTNIPNIIPTDSVCKQTFIVNVHLYSSNNVIIMKGIYNTSLSFF